MQFIKLLSVAATALVTFASALPVVEKRNVVSVELEQAANSIVKATLKNTGSSDVTFLKYGTILDDNVATRKVAVVKSGKEVQFEGMLLNYHLASLPESAFVTIPAGKSVTKEIEVAATHDLSEGGEYEIAAVGALPVADGTKLSNEALVFESNVLNINVDGAEAAKIETATKALTKRTSVQTSSCTSTQLTALRSALSNSASLSSAAATAATSGSATKFSEYFKTTATATRSTVAARFRGVVTQSSSTTSGGTSYYCSDVYGACSSNVLAYTLPSANTIANCPLYYSALPGLTRTCHAQDQATTSLHEFTHAPATYSPGTADNGYGYAAATALTSARAVLNADSYALYANAIYVGC